ncbi:MAG: hypothetical protein ACTSPV_07310 [Candidatus Hodarchaeales archaeon]
MSEVYDDMDYSNFLEYYFPLSEWFQHREIITDIQRALKERAESFDLLVQYKRQGFITVRYSLSTPQVFVFWAHRSLHDELMSINGVKGGNALTIPDKEKTSPRKRVVLLDFGVDSSELIKELSPYHLEVRRVWDYLRDLVQYELIEVCKRNYIDLLVTSNERLFSSADEYLQYLFPKRTRLCYSAPVLNQDLKELAARINTRAYTPQKRGHRTLMEEV